MESPTLSQSLEELRGAFDGAFALPRAPREERILACLAVRLGSISYALRLDQVSGVERGRRILPLPGSPPALMGVAGVRGQLVPVFSLSTLLGAESGAGEARWLALVDRERPLGFAFPSLEAYLRARAQDLRPLEGASTKAWLQGYLDTETGSLPVVDLGRLAKFLVKDTGPQAP